MKKRLITLVLCSAVFGIMFMTRPTYLMADDSQTGRHLTIGIIQGVVSDWENTEPNFEYLKTAVNNLMLETQKPELVVANEYILGIVPEMIPGPMSNKLSAIAKEHGIYLIPGTMAESHPDLKEGQFYNSAPVFNPKGEIIAVYRKMAPFFPVEGAVPGDKYVLFDIPELGTKVGVEICYDAMFPEITRNLVLMGADVIVKPTWDPVEYNVPPNTHIPAVRAFENQVYFVNVNAADSRTGGLSKVVDPEGKVIFQLGDSPKSGICTIDLDYVKKVREQGTYGIDEVLRLLPTFSPPMPYAEKVNEAPVFKNLIPATTSPKEYQTQSKKFGIGTLH